MTKKHHVMLLVVEGQRSFPIDMLRYDSCVPAEERDSRAIERSVWPEARAVERVSLRRFAVDDDRGHHLAEKRWNAFGWKVISYELMKS